MAGSGEHPAVRRTPSRGRSPARSSQLRNDCRPRHVQDDGDSPRRESSFLVLPMLPIERHSGPAFAGVYRYPPLKGMGSSGNRYHTLFIAFEIRLQYVVLRLPNRRLDIRPHVQESLVGLDSEWEGHLTRWVLAIQSELLTDTALPPFPAAGGAPPEGEALASESDSRVKGQMETGDTADRATKNPQIARGRDVTSLGRSGVPLTQPTAASAILVASASM